MRAATTSTAGEHTPLTAQPALADARTSGWGERWRFWRSPCGQAAWARPALLGVACVAGVAYAWGSNNADVEPFYAAAARSMSASWHDFVFGAFDPAGTVTVDKLPGALWVQALALRILGFHEWALVAPQVLEGAATILVLYRAVRRLAGELAAITAATVLALAPVTVALNRGNVSDSLLILLTVLAADATAAALLSGRARTLALAGVWVGLAFQAKMLQAWLVLPALALAYIVAAPPRLRTRVLHVVLASLVTVAVSLSWMTAVTLVPARDRPYVDGTTNDSVYTQVFGYNGVARLSHKLVSAGPTAGFLRAFALEGSALNSQTAGIPASWHRLLGGLFGRDDAWLLPAALIAAAGVLLERRGATRRDPMRACTLLWGTWLLVLAATFSEGAYLNSYYDAALSPATAALCGTGLAVFWRLRRRRTARIALAATTLASTGYGTYLLTGASAVPCWLVPAALALGATGALAALALSGARSGRASPLATALAATGVLTMSAASSLLVVTRDIGPFDSPYQPGLTDNSSFSAQRTAQAAQRTVQTFLATYHTPIAFAVDTSTLAARYILATGKEVLPIGGFAGGIPAPTLAQLQADITTHQLSAFLIPVRPASADPRIIWVRTHCVKTTGLTQSPRITFGVYYCAPHLRSLGRVPGL